MFGIHGPELWIISLIFIGIPMLFLLVYLNKMKNPIVNFIFPFLGKLNNGTIIRKILSTIINGFAYFTVIGIFCTCLYLLYLAIQMQVPVSVIIVLFIVIILFIIFSILAMQIQLFHANEIDNLPSSPFTITPIISIFFRMLGETYALFILTAGIILFFVTLFSLNGIMSMFPIGRYMPDSLFGLGNFGGGVILASLGILIGSFFSSLFILMSVYLISELLIVITDIAINVRLLLNKRNTNSVIPNSEFAQATVIQNTSECPSCKNNIKINDIFCENCGFKLK